MAGPDVKLTVGVAAPATRFSLIDEESKDLTIALSPASKNHTILPETADTSSLIYGLDFGLLLLAAERPKAAPRRVLCWVCETLLLYTLV